MKISEAQKTFAIGGFKAARIEPEAGGYRLILVSGGGETTVRQALKPDIKLYKSLDAAAADARKVGFDVVTVEGLQK